jgi:uncharacterized protein (TIGR03437 family)
MNTKMLVVKLSLLSLFIAFALCFGWTDQPAHANISQPPAARTGAPGELTCATSDCHGTNQLNSGAGVLNLTGLPANYTPGQDVTLTVSLSMANRGRFGFQVTALDSQNRLAGTLTVTETSRTQRYSGVIGGNLRQYIAHTQVGTGPNGPSQNSWTFRWTPPTQNPGPVTFYVAGNAANGEVDQFNDFIYTKTFTTQPVVAPQAVATVSAASFTQGALASETIAALFAAGGLADSVVTADTVPLPTTLGNVVVRVKDAAGVERNAPLFFVSGAQINFLVPQGTGNGAAAITVLKSNVAVGAGTLNIDTVSPGLFTATSNGQGIPAAVLFRLKANNEQSIEAMPAQIDLGPAGEQVFLIGFGTGFRNNSGLASVTCTMGGLNAPVSFAGAQGDLAGLDQTNIAIPRELIGRGLVDVVFTVNGKNANTVQLNIK